MTIETAPLLPLPTDDNALIRRADLPSYLGVSHQTLARWAHEGLGPDYIKMGGKLVAYRVGDLRNWLDANRRSKANAA